MGSRKNRHQVMPEENNPPIRSGIQTVLTLEIFDSLSVKWVHWLERFENSLQLAGVDGALRKHYLIHYIGKEAYEILSTKIFPENPGDISYDIIKKSLSDYYDPALIEIAENYKFQQRRQRPGETVKDYLTALAINCNFGHYLETALRNQLVFGIHSRKTLEELLRVKDLTLKKTMEIATSKEISEKASLELHRESYNEDVQAVKTYGRPGAPKSTYRDEMKNKPKGNCYRCGRSSHLANSCLFKSAICHQCGKQGHLQAVCRSQGRRVQSLEDDGEKFHEYTDAAGLQRFDKQPEYSEVNPGDDIKLDCRIFDKRGTCSWQKDNKPVGIYAKKYEWAGSQESGDCSLWVRAATLDFDDGEWECQVTASEFTTQDALTSTPARLVVRVAPQRPRIDHKSTQVLPLHNVTVRSGEKATVKCVSHYGNPPAKLKWFLGDTELPSNQSNSPEADNKRTWVATSLLEIHVDKVQHRKLLRCAAIHESYATKVMTIDVRLDVTYPPEVRLVGVPAGDLEENKYNVVLQCVTDANPPASVVWRKNGRTDIASLEERLQFRPVTRRDSGTYSCLAENKMGKSDPLTVSLDVKFGPSIRTVGPDKLTTATLFGEATFDCEAEASPTPSYQWLQQVPDLELPLVVSNVARLNLRNVTYQKQGEYICRVWNYIGGTERAVMSDPVTLQVVGGPQVMRGSWGGEVVALRGEDVTFGLVVCADPRPRHAAWEWGSLHLQVGQGLGRYQAEQLVQEERREDCYVAKLHIREVDPTDSRTYHLKVENDRGTDKHSLRLAVREPLSLMTVVTLAGSCLTLFLVVVICGVYCARTEKCCFSRRNDFQPADLESEKSDMESSLGRKVGSERCLTRPPEPLYRTHNITAPSPEAMKREHKRRKRRQRKEPELPYSEPEVPTVSSAGGCGNRMNYYARAFPDYQPQYFCPGQQSTRVLAYERTMRASSFYQPNSIDKAEI